jgi:hypothetical protein
MMVKDPVLVSLLAVKSALAVGQTLANSRPENKKTQHF